MKKICGSVGMLMLGLVAGEVKGLKGQKGRKGQRRAGAREGVREGASGSSVQRTATSSQQPVIRTGPGLGAEGGQGADYDAILLARIRVVSNCSDHHRERRTAKVLGCDKTR